MHKRRIVIIRDTVFTDPYGISCTPVTRIAVAAVTKNPLANGYKEDLAELFDTGAALGESLMGELALIPSNVKIGAVGSRIDVPLGHKDEAWSFAHFDTMTVSVPDAPLPEEIVMIMAIADGGRINPRVGDGPTTK